MLDVRSEALDQPALVLGDMIGALGTYVSETEPWLRTDYDRLIPTWHREKYGDPCSTASVLAVPHLGLLLLSSQTYIGHIGSHQDGSRR